MWFLEIYLKILVDSHFWVANGMREILLLLNYLNAIPTEGIVQHFVVNA